MPIKTWTLTDVAAGVYVDHLSLRSEHVGGRAREYEVTKRTLRGGLSDGVDVVHVRAGDLALDLLPTRGMGLWKAWFRGEEIGWRSPVRGPVHPMFVPIAEPGGLGWLDGFDELLVRCGLESNGAPDFDDRGRLLYPLHGRIANKPAHRVSVAIDGEAGEIVVTGVVEETRFHFLKLRLTSTYTVKIGEGSIRLHDEVENSSGSPTEFQVLYHINFGEPLLDAGARVVAPVKTVVPRDARAAEDLDTWNVYARAVPGYAEQCYLFELLSGADGRTQTLLRNAQGTRGVSIHFLKPQLPCFTLWKNTISSPDGYVTGLEPGTNFPNPRTYEGRQGRTVKLAPGGRTAFDLELEIHPSAAAVGQAEAAVAALQAAAPPQILREPPPGWCAP